MRIPTSGFLGVWWEAERGRWAAGVYDPGPPKRTRRIAHFDDEKSAALAHDRVVLFLFGPMTRRNFPHRKLVPASVAEIRRELRKLAKSHMTSHWEGVYRLSKRVGDRPWVAEIGLPDGRLVQLGCWPTERLAAIARDRAALHYFGMHKALNLATIARRRGAADVRALRAESERGRGRKSTTSSRYRGVIWAKQNRCWRSRITVDGHLRHLGLFADEQDAARAYDAAAAVAFGTRTTLNFPRRQAGKNRDPALL